MSQPFMIVHIHKLIGVEIHEREVMGEMQKCVSIPMDLNGISSVNNGRQIYLSFWLSKCLPNSKGHTHYLSLRYHKTMLSWYRKIKEMGLWPQVKYIGNIFGVGGRYEYTNKKGEKITQSIMDKAFEK